MKTHKILPLILLGLLTVTSCSGGHKTDWTEQERTTITTYTYYTDIPYMYIPGNGEMTYVEEGNYLTLTGGSANQDTIKDYVTVFETSDWELQNNYVQDKVAIYTIEKSVPNDFLYLELNICCVDSEGYLANSGTFLMNVFATLKSSILTAENVLKTIITNYYSPETVENIDSLIITTDEGKVWEFVAGRGTFNDVHTHFDKVEASFPDYINVCMLPKTESTNMPEIADKILGSMWMDEAYNVGVRVFGWVDSESNIHIQTTTVQL